MVEHSSRVLVITLNNVAVRGQLLQETLGLSRFVRHTSADKYLTNFILFLQISSNWVLFGLIDDAFS